MHTTKIKSKSFVDFLENAWESKSRSKEYRFRNAKSISSPPPSSKNASELNNTGSPVLYKCKICKRAYLKLSNLEKHEKSHDDKNGENGKKSASKKSKKLRHASKAKEKLEEDTKSKRKSRSKKHSLNAADEVRESSAIGEPTLARSFQDLLDSSPNTSSYSTANFHNIEDLISQPQGMPSSGGNFQSGLYQQEMTSNLERSELENTTLLTVSCPQSGVEGNTKNTFSLQIQSDLSWCESAKNHINYDTRTKSVVFFQPIEDTFHTVNKSTIPAHTERGVFEITSTEEEVQTQVTRILDLLNKEKPTDADSDAQSDHHPETNLHGLTPVALNKERDKRKHSQTVTQMAGVNDESDDHDDMHDADFSDDNISDLGEDISRKPVEKVWESIIEKKVLGANDKATEEDLPATDSDETEKKSKSHTGSMDKGQDDNRQRHKIKLEGSDSEHERDDIEESYNHEHNDSEQEHHDSETEQVDSEPEQVDSEQKQVGSEHEQDGSKQKPDGSRQEPIDNKQEQDSYGEKNESNLEHAKNDDNGPLICSKLYWCSVCHEEFDDSNTYKVHRRKHVYPKLLKNAESVKPEQPACDLCGKVFKNKTGLSLHRKIHSRNTQCEKCKKTFSNPYALKHHQKHVHNVTSREHICEICGKDYLRTSSLQAHRSAMHDDATFECKECGKVFHHQSNLRKHMRTHFGEKSFVCECCGKAFKFSGPLHRHMRIHKNEKLFECVTCGKSFRTNYNLTVHMRTHTMEKPYKCPICKEGFNHNVSLKAHMQKCHS